MRQKTDRTQLDDKGGSSKLWHDVLDPVFSWPLLRILEGLLFCCSVANNNMSDSATAWTGACQASLSFTILWILLKLMSIESVMPSNHLILWGPLLFLPSIFPSIRIFFSESALHIRWPEFWSFSISISPFNDYLELISFRID